MSGIVVLVLVFTGVTVIGGTPADFGLAMAVVLGLLAATTVIRRARFRRAAMYYLVGVLIVGALDFATTSLQLRDEPFGLLSLRVLGGVLTVGLILWILGPYLREMLRSES